MLIRIDTGELWTESIGSGPPILVMHGGLGLDHTYLRPYLDALAAAHRVIYYDHRGNGRSSPIQDSEQMTHAKWIRDADQLRARLGLNKVIVLGHSYGGYLAQEYALAYPDRIAALILCSTAPAFDYAPAAMANIQARGSAELIQFVAQAFSQPCPSDDALKQSWPRILPLYFHRYDPARHLSLLANTIFRAAPFNHAFFQCLPKFDVAEDIRRLNMPTLILGGGDDWIVPHTYGAGRLHRLIPNSELVLFRESGHFPFVEEHDSFTATVGDWLERLHG